MGGIFRGIGSFLGFGNNGDKVSGTSNDTVEIILGISEGQIEGVLNGAKSVYFDKTPLRNTDGTWNFRKKDIDSDSDDESPTIKFAYTVGKRDDNMASFGDPYKSQLVNILSKETTEQDFILSTEFIVPVGTEVKKENGAVIRFINTAGLLVSKLEVKLAFTLQKTEDGNPVKTGVDFVISLKTGEGAFIEKVRTRVYARYPSPTAKVYSIEIPSNISLSSDPNATHFAIKVEKLTDDGDGSEKTNTIQFVSIAAVISDRVEYNNTALAYLQFPSTTFQNLPETWMKVAGIKIPIPSNATVDPIDRGLTFNNNIWDGQFYTPDLACADPAWVVWYMLTTNKYYLGIEESQIDKFALYACSLYNNELVPKDTQGTTEKRFLFNTILGTGGQENILELVRNVCSTMNVKPFWNGSQISFWQDKPTTPLPKILSNADVENGSFQYISREFLTTTTVAKVGYISIEEDWENLTEVIENSELIDKYGLQSEEYALLGETRRSAAIRSGRKIILDSLPTNKQIVCIVRPQAMFFMPGDVIQVADSAKNRIRSAGLIKSATANTIELDYPITFLTAGSKILRVTMPDGSTSQKTLSIASAGDYDILEVPLPFTLADGITPSVPNIGATWLIEDETHRVELYRILTVEPNGESEMTFKITGLTYDPTRYEQIEYGIDPPELEIIPKLPTIAYPPSNITGELKLIALPSDRTIIESEQELPSNILGLIQNTSYALIASWQPPINTNTQTTDIFTNRYIVEFKRGLDGEWQQRQETTALSVRWENLTTPYIGSQREDYYIRIASVTVNGKSSPFTEILVESDGVSTNLTDKISGASNVITSTTGNIGNALDEINNQINTVINTTIPSSVNNAVSGITIIPIGTILPFGGESAPSGYLICDGSSISTGQYPNLFAVLGYKYGGSLNTFNIPDMRGRFPLGTDIGYPMGLEDGQANVTLTIQQMPIHSHQIYAYAFGGADNSNSFSSANVGITGEKDEPNNNMYISTDGGNHQLIQDTGGSQPHTNMPPYLVINYIIKY